MVESVTTPRPQDVFSVGSRISWGAIFAGAFLALGIYSLLTILGGAVGLSIGEKVNPTTLKNTAIAWTLITLVAAIFVGGVITSQFTVGETTTEAMLYGVIMWAVLFSALSILSALGAKAGFHALAGMGNYSESTSMQSWDKMARDAGVPADQVNQWMQKMAPDKMAQEAQNPQNQEAAKEAVTRITWYVFAGTWISMIAAAIGAIVGAGPRFKVVTVRQRVL